MEMGEICRRWLFADSQHCINGSMEFVMAFGTDKGQRGVFFLGEDISWQRKHFMYAHEIMENGRFMHGISGAREEST